MRRGPVNQASGDRPRARQWCRRRNLGQTHRLRGPVSRPAPPAWPWPPRSSTRTPARSHPDGSPWGSTGLSSAVEMPLRTATMRQPLDTLVDADADRCVRDTEQRGPGHLRQVDDTGR